MRGAPRVTSAKRLFLSSAGLWPGERDEHQIRLLCFLAPVEAPRSFFLFFRFRRGETHVFCAFSPRRLKNATPVAVRACPNFKNAREIMKNHTFSASAPSPASAPLFATPIALSRPRRRLFFCLFRFFLKIDENSTSKLVLFRPPRRFSRPLSHFLALGGGTFLIIFF